MDRVVSVSLRLGAQHRPDALVSDRARRALPRQQLTLVVLETNAKATAAVRISGNGDQEWTTQAHSCGAIREQEYERQDFLEAIVRIDTDIVVADWVRWGAGRADRYAGDTHCCSYISATHCYVYISATDTYAHTRKGCHYGNDS